MASPLRTRAIAVGVSGLATALITASLVTSAWWFGPVPRLRENVSIGLLSAGRCFTIGEKACFQRSLIDISDVFGILGIATFACCALVAFMMLTLGYLSINQSTAQRTVGKFTLAVTVLTGATSAAFIYYKPAIAVQPLSYGFALAMFGLGLALVRSVGAMRSTALVDVPERSTPRIRTDKVMPLPSEPQPLAFEFVQPPESASRFRNDAGMQAVDSPPMQRPSVPSQRPSQPPPFAARSSRPSLPGMPPGLPAPRVAKPSIPPAPPLPIRFPAATTMNPPASVPYVAPVAASLVNAVSEPVSYVAPIDAVPLMNAVSEPGLYVAPVAPALAVDRVSAPAVYVAPVEPFVPASAVAAPVVPVLVVKKTVIPVPDLPTIATQQQAPVTRSKPDITRPPPRREPAPVAAPIAPATPVDAVVVPAAVDAVVVPAAVDGVKSRDATEFDDQQPPRPRSDNDSQVN